jgi:hypothetical protein
MGGKFNQNVFSMHNMKKLLYLLFAATLLGSCASDDSKEILPGGTPVEVSLSFAVAAAEYPQVEVRSGGGSVSKASSTSAAKTSPLQVSYTAPTGVTQTASSTQTTGATGTNAVQLRSGTSLSNVWVLQFDSTQTTGATTTTDGACVAAKYIGTVTTGDNLNPTLLTGTGQVIYVIANGPAAGGITTGTTTNATLETFKNSAYFSGSIGGDAKVPYLGRIAGGTTIEANGEVYAADATPVITLYRIAAKISLNLNFAVTGYTLSSVQMFNVPTYMYYLNGAGTESFPTASSSYITTTGKTADSIPSTAASGTYTWYTGENKRGTSSTATTAYLKDFLHTPTDNSSQYYCTYIRVQARKNDSTTVMNYYLYVGANGTTDFNVKRNWDYTINATMGGNEATQQAYMGIDGRIRMATSNCYIVAPGGSITIPVNVKGNANGPLPPDASSTVLAGTGLDAFQTTAAATVSVLWQTATGLISVGTFNTTTQTVTISAPSTTTTGNGVVAAYDASNNVLWSWHIWVTDYIPNSAANVNAYIYNSRHWMDRNLGATTTTAATVTTLGLLYQWGRKDPFPGSTSVNTEGQEPTLVGTFTSVTKTQVTETGFNLANTILYPLTFYYGTSDNIYDWYSVTGSAHNDALWGGASTTTTPTAKTIFDPCPAGWRVPTWKNSISPWTGFGTYNTSLGDVYNEYTYFPWYSTAWETGYGRIYNLANNTYYPAAGYRSAGSGALYNVGGRGLYWSASPYAGYGFALTFDSGGVSPAGYGHRADGFSVRCVQEF